MNDEARYATAPRITFELNLGIACLEEELRWDSGTIFSSA
jgi:hypothetical protein